MFDVIERLKAEWTDKYVIIDSPAPELSRFAKTTGTVRTVNMNGRCLVEFDQFNNIGWYDIDPSHLKVVTEPLPKPEKPTKVKAAPAVKTSASKASSPQKKSTADILAAARGGSTKPAGKLSTAEILAKARGAKASPPPAATDSKPDGSALQEEPIAPDETPEQNEQPQAKESPAGDLPTTIEDKIAWCRQHDAQ
ncbi:MAG: hypothetical protein VX902_02715 [Planctomycetota bacterium]|jgi:hypothetical protein|nr:hypothetical protein [Planctomycetota bacterium]